ncbi:MFS transporter [Dyella mobilis]|uniref:NarK/NasA family nitrate transporter n=1 Tax=Dyella mobilis TaxID=1849582 RepID=A0ABS2KMJ6_9GAMM|nr:MFS transporter [Dyella mobilis]MBM7132376.1 NarK/NasA family nitrate transporter [Dyella mobilis]GLQ95636.1 nitrate/nitrite transporter [Dyella mobilis]
MSAAYRVLFVSTFAFVTCFAVWMAFGVIGIPIRHELNLNATEFGFLTATPVLSGAALRLPLGIWTDRFGGRSVMTILLVVAAIPVWLVSYATQLWQFLAIGLCLGAVGASFAVGTPYVARFFPANRRGFAMGFFGAGTSGAALNMFVAPIIVDRWGWRAVPHIYAIALLVTAAIFWLLSAPDPGLGGKQKPPGFAQQMKVLRDPRVWKYCQYYSLTFGGFTALSLWMPQYFSGEYGLGIAMASALAASFSLPAGALRAVGGVLSDRVGAHALTWWVLWLAWIALFLLSYPQTQMVVQTIRGPASFHIGLNLWTFTPLLFVLGVALAFGMASTFKYLGDDFSDSLGVVTGIVGLAGGLGGFLLPILWGGLLDLLGIRSSAFMLLYGIVWVSLILIYFTEVRQMDIRGRKANPQS